MLKQTGNQFLHSDLDTLLWGVHITQNARSYNSSMRNGEMEQEEEELWRSFGEASPLSFCSKVHQQSSCASTGDQTKAKTTIQISASSSRRFYQVGDVHKGTVFNCCSLR